MSTTYPEYPNTNFPDSQDSWNTFLDVVQTDATLLAQYQTYMLAGDFQNAATIFTQIPNANQKFVGAAVMNSLADAIMSLEQFYSTDIATYVSGKQSEWQAVIDQFTYVGIYDSTLTYENNNIVMYPINGLNYLYLNVYENGDTPIGTLPTNTTYWRVFTIRGAQGIAGSNNTFYFDWKSYQTYYTNNIVSYENSLWIALQESTNSVPADGSLYWKIIMTIPQVVYPVQSETPQSQNIGDLWFEVIT